MQRNICLLDMAARPVLISRPDRVGDVIITTTCFPSLRQTYPGAPLILMAQPIMGTLFAKGGEIDEFYPLPATLDIGILQQKMEEWNPQAVFHFHPQKEIEAAAAAAQIPERYGFVFADEKRPLTRSFPLIPKPVSDSGSRLHGSDSR